MGTLIYCKQRKKIHQMKLKSESVQAVHQTPGSSELMSVGSRTPGMMPQTPRTPGYNNSSIYAMSDAEPDNETMPSFVNKPLPGTNSEKYMEGMEYVVNTTN